MIVLINGIIVMTFFLLLLVVSSVVKKILVQLQIKKLISHREFKEEPKEESVVYTDVDLVEKVPARRPLFNKDKAKKNIANGLNNLANKIDKR